MWCGWRLGEWRVWCGWSLGVEGVVWAEFRSGGCGVGGDWKSGGIMIT